MNKVIVITGASAGIGRATALMLQEQGNIVYNLSRRETLDFKYIKTDITKIDEIKVAIETINKNEGRIDVLINNAGMGISGAIENTDLDDVNRLFAVNFFGAFNVTKEVLPIMRKQQSGTIINISSAASKFPLPFQSFYSASKAAISSFSDALRLELKPFNIKVSAIMPGDVKTEFTNSRVKNKSDDPVYAARIDKSVSMMEKDEQNGMLPTEIAKKIIRTINKKNPPPYVTPGFKYAFLVFLTRFLPYRVVLSLLGIIYG